jgi:hypothetical protein
MDIENAQNPPPPQVEVESNMCIYSSTVFLVNCCIALYFNYFIYGFLFLILWLTSIIFRLWRNIYTNIIDKIAIWAVVVYGGNLFFQKLVKVDGIRDMMVSVLIINTFLAVIFLYFVGYILKKYCYCESPIMQERYHALLHLISCVGHVLIVIL